METGIRRDGGFRGWRGGDRDKGLAQLAHSVRRLTIERDMCDERNGGGGGIRNTLVLLK
jgi:hypothetical protein